MKYTIQIQHTKAIMFGLIISGAALSTSCAPKYGCYSMTQTRVTTQDGCDQNFAEYKTPAVEAFTDSR